jgi:hypothetical protein
MSRRAALIGAAAVPAAVALPALAAAAEPDPIFAAIELHRAAAERWQILANESPKGEADYPVFQEDFNDAGSDNNDAVDALAETVPTTMAGVVALFDYINRYVTFDLDGVLKGKTHVELLTGQFEIEGAVDSFGERARLTFPYMVIRNALAALKSMQGVANV